MPSIISCMDQSSEETARRVEENDPTLTDLIIGFAPANVDHEVGGMYGPANVDHAVGGIKPNSSSDLAKLGKSIGNNTSLYYMEIHGDGLPNATTATHSYHAFFEGFERNRSIISVGVSGCDLSRGVGYEMLKSLEEDYYNIEAISIASCDLGNGGIRVLASTLAACWGVEILVIMHCDIDDEDLGEIILASIIGHDDLKHIDLSNNNIGRAGCDALAILLKDPNSNIQTLLMENNNIDDKCLAVLANGLYSSNCELKQLCLDGNPQITSIGLDALSTVLCNTSSTNDTYLSNHTLHEIKCSSVTLTDDFRQLLELNNGINKRLVAMRKILQYHTHLDMEPFFKWNLKVLPLAVAWFDSAIDRLREGEGMNADEIMGVSARKLSSIYQFVRAMPMTCVTSANEKGAKRKLDAVE